MSGSASQFLLGRDEDGCDLYGHCLTCPLPRCRFDMAAGKAGKWARALHMQTLINRGLDWDEICREMGISRRTYYRLWRMVREMEEGIR